MRRFSSLGWRTIVFGIWCASVVSVLWLLMTRFNDNSVIASNSSQTILLPACVAYLIWSARIEIFSTAAYALKPAAIISAISLAIGSLPHFFAAQPGSEVRLLLGTVSALLLIVAGFWGCYGTIAMKRSASRFCFLALMLPLPSVVANTSISFLQYGSAKLSAALFSLLDVPVYSNGVFLTVPGVTIEVARECSGINSSIALFITMLVVGFESLNANWRRIVLLVVTIPLSVLKNAIRIVTLTLLALHVDRGFLTGRLHHAGGFVFYLIALVVMYPIWKLLKNGQKKGINEAQIATGGICSYDA